MHQASFFFRPAEGTIDGRLRNEGDLHRIDVRCIQEQKDQNAVTTIACIEESIKQLVSVRKHVKQIYIFSDGAPNYTASELAVNLHGISTRTGVQILEHAKWCVESPLPYYPPLLYCIPGVGFDGLPL